MQDIDLFVFVLLRGFGLCHFCNECKKVLKKKEDTSQSAKSCYIHAVRKYKKTHDRKRSFQQENPKGEYTLATVS